MSKKTENSRFVCKNCGKYVEAIKHGTIRNHCPNCLFSLHVDNVIGDRLCDCHGLMKPVDVLFNSKKGWQIVHLCTVCGFKRRNITADDDDFEMLIKIINKSKGG